jgi:hypothetical protein
MLKLKSMMSQKSTWAGIAAIIAVIGGYFTGTVDLQAAASGIIGGLILIFMPEFQKPSEPPK